MIKLFKSLLIVISTFAFTAVSQATGISAGIAGNAAFYAATGIEKESTETTKEYGGFEASHIALFLEYAPSDQFSIGVEYAPESLDSPEVVNVQEDMTTTKTSTKKTNKVSASFEDLTTIYAMVNHSSGAYLKVGYVMVDAVINDSLATGSNYNDVDTDGYSIGLGYRYTGDNGMFIGLEVMGTEFDDISATSTTNTDNSVTIEDAIGATASLRIGKTF